MQAEEASDALSGAASDAKARVRKFAVENGYDEEFAKVQKQWSKKVNEVWLDTDQKLNLSLRFREVRSPLLTPPPTHTHTICPPTSLCPLLTPTPTRCAFLVAGPRGRAAQVANLATPVLRVL